MCEQLGLRTVELGGSPGCRKLGQHYETLRLSVVGAFDQVEEQFIYLFSSLLLRTLKNSASNSA